LTGNETGFTLFAVRLLKTNSFFSLAGCYQFTKAVTAFPVPTRSRSVLLSVTVSGDNRDRRLQSCRCVQLQFNNCATVDA